MSGRKRYVYIPIKKETYEKLQKFGDFGDSWDSLLNKIVDELERLKATKIEDSKAR